VNQLPVKVLLLISSSSSMASISILLCLLITNIATPMAMMIAISMVIHIIIMLTEASFGAFGMMVTVGIDGRKPISSLIQGKNFETSVKTEYRLTSQALVCVNNDADMIPFRNQIDCDET